MEVNPMSFKANRNCPNCGLDQWWSVDNPTEYIEFCEKCSKRISFDKIQPKENFVCDSCGSTECVELDTDLDFSLMCAKCKTTKIIFTKHEITVNNRNKPKRSQDEIQASIQNLRNMREEMLTPKCPRCGSKHIVTGSRGFSLLTGFIGANKTVNRCANCGYSYYPKR